MRLGTRRTPLNKFRGSLPQPVPVFYKETFFSTWKGFISSNTIRKWAKFVPLRRRSVTATCTAFPVLRFPFANRSSGGARHSKFPINSPYTFFTIVKTLRHHQILNIFEVGGHFNGPIMNVLMRLPHPSSNLQYVQIYLHFLEDNVAMTPLLGRHSIAGTHNRSRRDIFAGELRISSFDFSTQVHMTN